MASGQDPPELDSLLSDSTQLTGNSAPADNDDSLFTTPSAKKGAQPSTTPPSYTPQLSAADREAALRAELASLQNINSTLTQVISSLRAAQNNMHTLNRTVHSSTTLLDTWTRILGQTEHNQRLILNPSWNGASADAAELEREESERKERERQKEERERREREERLAELERRRLLAETQTTGQAGRGTRGRTRASSSIGRGTTGTGRTYTGTGIQRGSRVGRSASGIGRGRVRGT